MAVRTETELGAHPITVIEQALAETVGRDLMSADRVRDLFLDAWLACARWDSEAPE